MKYINIEKLEKIKLTKNNFYTVIDFDATITAENSASSWGVPEYYLPNEMKSKSAKLVGIYEPIEIDTTIGFEEKEKKMIEWYTQNIELFYEYGLTKEMLEKAVSKTDLIFRNGAIEFLKCMYENNIPVIILSAGIGNAIELFLEANNCYYKNIFIISNFLEFDENGKMKKYDNKNLIHTLNKATKNHLPDCIYKKVKERENRLLLGDLIDDKKMIDPKGWNKTLFVGFLNKNIKENFNAYKRNFDIVLTERNATFKNVMKILEMDNWN